MALIFRDIQKRTKIGIAVGSELARCLPLKNSFKNSCLGQVVIQAIDIGGIRQTERTCKGIRKRILSCLGNADLGVMGLLAGGSFGYEAFQLPSCIYSRFKGGLIAMVVSARRHNLCRSIRGDVISGQQGHLDSIFIDNLFVPSFIFVLSKGGSLQRALVTPYMLSMTIRENSMKDTTSAQL
ncbi:hypothetical protein HNQ38_001250 [Desulfovibrio intestinalis]|uniref:Uncharacterized protein n=1 Tax=Desulfovibrio intestinalis TaxID=58621 RepID=A0A7W8FGV3_9BACT|nr:hypothetical protein [Desulfovibrio intestinalis]